MGILGRGNSTSTCERSRQRRSGFVKFQELGDTCIRLPSPWNGHCGHHIFPQCTLHRGGSFNGNHFGETLLLKQQQQKTTTTQIELFIFLIFFFPFFKKIFQEEMRIKEKRCNGMGVGLS